jgi:hypothetical protein
LLAGNRAKSPPIREFSFSNWIGENVHPAASARLWGDFLRWADWQSGFVNRETANGTRSEGRSIDEGSLTLHPDYTH